MIPILAFALLTLVAVCATLYVILLSAARDIEALEDFIVELDECLDDVANPRVTPSELRDELKEEADDTRSSRKEEGEVQADD